MKSISNGAAIRELSQMYPWLLAILAALSGNWTATAVDDVLVEFAPDSKSLIRIAEGVLFLFAIGLLFRLRKTNWWTRQRNVSTADENIAPSPHLVLILSGLNAKNVDANGIPLIKQDGSSMSISGSLDELINRLDHYKADRQIDPWPWEMTFRALRHHLQGQTLESVTLVCSKESFANLREFHQLFCRFTQLSRAVQLNLLINEHGQAKVVSYTEGADSSLGWDIRDFKQLTNAFRQLYVDFKSRSIPESDVVVDFTSGNKIISVVAATSTYGSKVRAQYVQPGATPEFLAYDIVIDQEEPDGMS